MKVEIEVKDKSLNDVIIQCFQKRNIKHDRDLVFVSSGHKDDFANMFLSMFQLINNDDIYPYLEKVDFIDDNGDQEDVLEQAYKIRKNDLYAHRDIEFTNAKAKATKTRQISVDISLNEKEMELTEKYAQKHSLSLEKAFKQALFEKIKDR